MHWKFTWFTWFGEIMRSRYNWNIIVLLAGLMFISYLDLFLLYPIYSTRVQLALNLRKSQVIAGSSDFQKKSRLVSFESTRHKRDGDDTRPYIFPEGRLYHHQIQNVTVNVTDSDCSAIKVAPKGSMMLRVLYSADGSGVSWLRHLLEMSSGFYTGSHYRDSEDYMAGFTGESLDPLDKNTLIVKSNGPNVTTAFGGQRFQSSVILIRNPYRSILSSYYKVQYNEGNSLDDQIFKSKEWINFVETESRKWYSGGRCTCLDVRPSITVFYEDLVKNTEYELRRVLSFLEVNSSVERMECALSRSDRVFRKYKGPVELNVDPYSIDMKVAINRRIQSLREVFRYKKCGVVPQYEINLKRLNQTGNVR